MPELITADFTALSRLRARFLDGTNSGGGYWRSEQELALYDATFGERIGWKWDAVLAELAARGWSPRSRSVLDFGCGSGIAGRRVLAQWPQLESLALADVSPLAVSFAEKKARELFPAVRIEASHLSRLTSHSGLLVISHIINELTPAARERLLALARTAEEILWVEAGTHAESRALIAVREELRGEFGVVAPCTHAAPCGMFAAENARHWCHHFARVPEVASRDAGWRRFAKELCIDLTTLPYSYLVLQRAAAPAASGTRIIGLPREAKGRMELLCCDERGVAEHTLQKRDEPELFKDLHKARANAIQPLRIVEGKVRAK